MATGPPHSTAGLHDLSTSAKFSLRLKRHKMSPIKYQSHSLPAPAPLPPKPPQLSLLNGDTLDRTDRELSQQRVAQGGHVHCKSSANDNTEPRGSLRIFLNTVPRELLLNWLQWTQERNPIHRSRNGEQSVWGSAGLSSSQTLRHHLHDFW